jgi:hypothetical protein
MVCLPRDRMAAGPHKQTLLVRAYPQHQVDRLLCCPFFAQVSARQLILDAVEEHFDRPCQVSITPLAVLSRMYACILRNSYPDNRQCLRT